MNLTAPRTREGLHYVDIDGRPYVRMKEIAEGIARLKGVANLSDAIAREYRVMFPELAVHLRKKPIEHRGWYLPESSLRDFKQKMSDPARLARLQSRYEKIRGTYGSTPSQQLRLNLSSESLSLFSADKPSGVVGVSVRIRDNHTVHLVGFNDRLWMRLADFPDLIDTSGLNRRFGFSEPKVPLHDGTLLTASNFRYLRVFGVVGAGWYVPWSYKSGLIALSPHKERTRRILDRIDQLVSFAALTSATAEKPAPEQSPPVAGDAEIVEQRKSAAAILIQSHRDLAAEQRRLTLEQSELKDAIESLTNLIHPFITFATRIGGLFQGNR